MVSILIIKLCGESIYKTSGIIFKSCLNQGIFPVEQKETHAVPAYRKGIIKM